MERGRGLASTSWSTDMAVPHGTGCINAGLATFVSQSHDTTPRCLLLPFLARTEVESSNVAGSLCPGSVRVASKGERGVKLPLLTGAHMSGKKKRVWNIEYRAKVHGDTHVEIWISNLVWSGHAYPILSYLGLETQKRDCRWRRRAGPGAECISASLTTDNLPTGTHSCPVRTWRGRVRVAAIPGGPVFPGRRSGPRVGFI